MTIELDKLEYHSACVNAEFPCFACKAKMWRESGWSPFKKLQKGWAELPSVGARAREIERNAKRDGREIHLVDDRYRHF